MNQIPKRVYRISEAYASSDQYQGYIQGTVCQSEEEAIKNSPYGQYVKGWIIRGDDPRVPRLLQTEPDLTCFCDEFYHSYQDAEEDLNRIMR